MRRLSGAYTRHYLFQEGLRLHPTLQVDRTLLALSGKSIIVDGEVVADDNQGHPDFRTHQARKIKAEDLYVWCQAR
jgi:ATP-dependent DNA ligase